MLKHYWRLSPHLFTVHPLLQWKGDGVGDLDRADIALTGGRHRWKRSSEPVKAAFLGLVCLALCSDARAMNDEKAPTHCRSGEKVIFSCPLENGKTVSLCASPDLARGIGTLQYRFGRIGRAPEFSYPEPVKHPSAHFSYYPGEPFGDPKNQGFYGPSRILSFETNGYLYSLEVFKNIGTTEFYGSVSVRRRSASGGSSADVLADYTCALDQAIDRIDDLGEIGIPARR